MVTQCHIKVVASRVIQDPRHFFLDLEFEGLQCPLNNFRGDRPRRILHQIFAQCLRPGFQLFPRTSQRWSFNLERVFYEGSIVIQVILTRLHYRDFSSVESGRDYVRLRFQTLERSRVW